MHTTSRLLRLARSHLHSHAFARSVCFRLSQVWRLRTVSRFPHTSIRAAIARLDSLPPRPKPDPYGPQTREHLATQPHLPDFHIQQEHTIKLDTDGTVGEVPQSAA